MLSKKPPKGFWTLLEARQVVLKEGVPIRQFNYWARKGKLDRRRGEASISKGDIIKLIEEYNQSKKGEKA